MKSQELTPMQIALLHHGGIKADLARALDVSQQTIQNWEKRGIPHMASRAINSEYKKQITAYKKALLL